MTKTDLDQALVTVPGEIFAGLPPPVEQVIYLPALDALLLNQQIKVWTLQGAEHCPAQEWIPFQFFIDDFFNGQLWALRAVALILNARAEWSEAVNQSAWLHVIKELAGKFFNLNTRKILDLVRTQRAAFALSVPSAAEQEFVNRVSEYLSQNFSNERGLPALRPKDDMHFTGQILKIPGISRCSINMNDGRSLAGLCVFGKKYTMSNTWTTIAASAVGRTDNSARTPDAVKMAQILEQLHQLHQLCTSGTLSVSHRACTELPLLDQLASALSALENAASCSSVPPRTARLQKKFDQWRTSRLLEIYSPGNHFFK